MSDKFKVDIQINKKKLKKPLYGIFIVDNEDETTKCSEINNSPTPAPSLPYTDKDTFQSKLRPLLGFQEDTETENKPYTSEMKKEIEDEDKAIFYKNVINDVFCGKGNISSIDNYSTTCIAPNFKVNKCARDIYDIYKYSQGIPYKLKSYLDKQFTTKKSENLFYANVNNCMLACNKARQAAINDPVYQEYYCNSIVYIPPTKEKTGKCFLRHEKESNPFKKNKCQHHKGAMTYSTFNNEPYLSEIVQEPFNINNCDMTSSYELSSARVHINSSEPVVITSPTPNPCDLIPKPFCPTPCPQSNCPNYIIPPYPGPPPPPPVPGPTQTPTTPVPTPGPTQTPTTPVPTPPVPGPTQTPMTPVPTPPAPGPTQAPMTPVPTPPAPGPTKSSNTPKPTPPAPGPPAPGPTESPTPAPGPVAPTPPGVFNKLTTWLEQDINSIQLPVYNLDFELNDDNIYDIANDKDLYDFLNQPNSEINQNDWGFTRMGTGIHVLTNSSSEPITIRAKGWNYPMFWYEAKKSDNKKACIFVIQNIKFEFKNFTDSAIRLTHYLYNLENKTASDFNASDYNQIGQHSVEQTIIANLMLQGVTGEFDNFTNSPIYVSSRGWGDNDEDNPPSIQICDRDGDANTWDFVKENIKKRTLARNTICTSNGGDPYDVGLLTFTSCNLSFKNCNLGKNNNPSYHGGAAIYIKNGANDGHGTGITYAHSKLYFKNCNCILGNKALRSPFKNDDYDYYPEGGGAMRTNNLVAIGESCIMDCENCSIKINNLKGEPQLDYSADDDLSGDGGDGSWGGAIYANDGYWFQAQGKLNISNCTADYGCAVYCTNMQYGSFISDGNGCNNITLNNNKCNGNDATQIFAGGDSDCNK